MQSDAASALTSPQIPAVPRSVDAATVAHERLYRPGCSFYTALVIERRLSRKRPALLLYTATACFLFTTGWHAASAQEAQQKPAVEPAAKPTEKVDKPEKPAHPAQIELLETKVRFEANGDSRKEVHAVVKINNELGVRQFAQLNFDFNRSFETVEITMVHITHASGGTSDILPSAVTDHPNPAVVNAPAYQDVRVKSVRILGLQPGDTLEYRVIRTVSHHPLAPDFWLEHSFDRTGVVSHEIFELNLPRNDNLQIRINPETPATDTSTLKEGEEVRKLYQWKRDAKGEQATPSEAASSQSDISFTTFASWRALGERLTAFWKDSAAPDPAIEKRTEELTKDISDHEVRLRTLYGFISKEIKTVHLPLGASGFRPASPGDILASGFGTPLDKLRLLALICYRAGGGLQPAFLGEARALSDQLPLPSFLVAIVGASFVASPPSQGPDGKWGVCDHCGNIYWLDPSLAVAPFGMLRADERGKMALFLGSFPGEWPAQENPWRRVPNDLPFASMQHVNVTASLAATGILSARVKYVMRGDNELVLREAFHKTPKERWKEVAQLLSLTDGFRGQVTSASASDPYATKEPFTVDYELDQPKFVDWSKKTVRIPALLPQFGLPDPPAKPASGSATAPIDLGTPLEVETKMTLHLPPGTSASAPAGTSVDRDYATYSSKYSVNGSTLTATRHIKFILREVPAARAPDYNAFLRAVQNDESQDFTLESESTHKPPDKAHP